MTLQVIVAADGSGWAAQALEVDYAIGGESVADVKDRFMTGLRATAEAHLARNGTLAELKKAAPPEAWAPLAIQREGGETRIEREPMDLRRAGLTFDTVAYIVVAPNRREDTTVH